MTEIGPLPLPSFLIDPQDGEFTPYDARSLVDPSDSSDQSEHKILLTTSTKPSPSPVGPPSSSSLGFSPMTSTPTNTTSTRSRATSDALEKLLSIQAQQLTAIGEAWRAKFSLNRLTTCHESNLNEPYDTQINGLSKSQRSLRLASTRSHGSSVSKNEKEKSWNDGTRCSVDSLSNHASMFEETNDVQLDVKEEEEDRLETRHQDFTLLTEAVLHEFLHSTHHSIIDHKTLVLDWLNHSNFNDSDNFNGFQTDEL